MWVKSGVSKSFYSFIEPEWTICKAEGQGNTFGSDKIGVTTEDCVFPFKHDGKKYNACAPGKDGKGPWCATKVNSNQEMEKNKWARCNSICPTSKGKYVTDYFIGFLCIIH